MSRMSCAINYFISNDGAVRVAIRTPGQTYSVAEFTEESIGFGWDGNVLRGMATCGGRRVMLAIKVEDIFAAWEADSADAEHVLGWVLEEAPLAFHRCCKMVAPPDEDDEPTLPMTRTPEMSAQEMLRDEVRDLAAAGFSLPPHSRLRLVHGGKA